MNNKNAKAPSNDPDNASPRTSYPSAEMLQKLTLFSETKDYQTRPSKVILEFRLPEEEEFFAAAIRALDLKLILVDLVLWLSAIRHGKPPETPPCPALEPVLRVLEQKMDMLGLND
jgi:hypothetical protein